MCVCDFMMSSIGGFEIEHYKTIVCPERLSLDKLIYRSIKKCASGYLNTLPEAKSRRQREGQVIPASLSAESLLEPLMMRSMSQKQPM